MRTPLSSGADHGGQGVSPVPPAAIHRHPPPPRRPSPTHAAPGTAVPPSGLGAVGGEGPARRRWSRHRLALPQAAAAAAGPWRGGREGGRESGPRAPSPPGMWGRGGEFLRAGWELEQGLIVRRTGAGACQGGSGSVKAVLTSLVAFKSFKSPGREGTGQKGMFREFCLKLRRRRNFTVRVSTHWSRLSRGVMESPSLRVFRTIGMQSCAVPWDDPA